MSGGEIAKFVAAALGDKVVLEVSEENDALRDENGALCDENHRLLELLKGLLTVKLINATTGVCYGEGELEHDDYYDAFSTTCQACCHRPRVSLSIFLESPLHLVISGRFFGTLEGSRAVRAGLARWPSEGLAFCIASREGSKFRNFFPRMVGRDGEDPDRQNYFNFTGHDPQRGDWWEVDKPIADLLSVCGDQEVENVEISLEDEHKILRRPDLGIRN